jgi:hypothetical protein
VFKDLLWSRSFWARQAVVDAVFARVEINHHLALPKALLAGVVL